MPVVYCARNKINGHRYIGATNRTLEKRRKEHVRDAFGGKRALCKVFCAALRKYGEDGFEWTVLAEFSDAADAYAHEIKLIAELKPEYNITIGGYGLNGIKRSRETYEKIAKALTGKPLSAQHRAKVIVTLDQIRWKSRLYVWMTESFLRE